MRPQLATIDWFHKPATGSGTICSSFTPLVLAQVRGLTTTSFKSDEPKFEAMALASLDLCRTYVALYRQASGPESTVAASGSMGGARDLAAARMHLRGVIKQCETSFSGHKLLQDMKALLEEIVGMEEAFLAARANVA